MKRDPKPDEVLLIKYQEKLSFWQQKQDEAEEKCDWSAYNWASQQISAINAQIKDIKSFVSKKTKSVCI